MKDQYTVEEIEELIDTHREKFTEYWGLKENEEKLLEDFTQQFKELVNGELQKKAMKKVLDDMLEAEEE